MAKQNLRTVGLLGGMSPESTVEYYERINAGVRRALGGHTSCPMLAYSANLEEVFQWFATEDDQALGRHLAERALALQQGGAELMIIACNTAHKVAAEISGQLTIPLIHIADVLGEALVAAGHSTVGLLGSAITMQSSFYRDRLRHRFEIETVVPRGAEAERVDGIIHGELCFRDLREESRQDLAAIAAELGERGAEAIVLACTELVLLLDGQSVAGLPIFDTTSLHTERAVALALGARELPEAPRAA